MTDIDALRLAELMCSRICHDLAGPIGAAAAGAELLEGEGGTDAETLALLAASTGAAARHLRFFRAAFGHGSAPVRRRELRQLVAGYCQPVAGGAATHRVEWRDDDQTAYVPAAARLLLNIVLMARDALPRGGDLTVTTGSGESPRIEVAGHGPAVTLDEARRALADIGPERLSPRTAQARYAARLAAERGGVLELFDEFNGFRFCAGGQK